MAYLRAKVEHLIIENSEQQGTVVRSFATKPTSVIADHSGKLFGVIEIDSRHREVPRLIDLIINELKESYYHSEGQITATLSERFETALKKTNLAIASFIESEQITLDMERVHIAIGLSHNQELHFAVVGDVGMMLFYHAGRGLYRIINILENTKTTLHVPDPIKLFTQVISGKMRQRDILFITTANLLDYFSLESIKTAVTENGSVEQLKALIERTKSRENFAALALFLERVADSPAIKPVTNLAEFNYTEAASQDSIKELIRTERETAKLLTPSILPELKKYVVGFREAFGTYLKKASDGSLHTYQRSRSTHTVRRPALAMKIAQTPRPKLVATDFSKLQEQLQRRAAQAQAQVKKISGNLRQQPAWRNFLKKFGPLFEQLLGGVWHRFQQLPRSTKILVIAVVALTILLGGSIIWLGVNNAQQQHMEAFSQDIVTISNKKDEAQSSLIYRDEGQARRLLAEALHDIEVLTPTSDSQIQQQELLKREITSSLQELRYIITLDDPTQIINFQNLDPQAELADLLLLTNDTVYTQNLSNQAIYRANVNSRVMSSIFSPTANTGNFAIGVVTAPNELLLLNSSNAAFKVNIGSESIQNVTVNITDNASIKDVVVFNNRIYLLDSANSQIYRYAPIGAGYGSVANWITDTEAGLSRATSLAIDGAIYVLLSNGEVIKFDNGTQIAFTNTSVDPPLQQPTKIKTTDGSNFIYILDPPTKRIVVLNKEGQLIQQYTSEAFWDLKDFVVNEAASEIYVLNGTAVLGVPLQHLQ